MARLIDIHLSITPDQIAAIADALNERAGTLMRLANNDVALHQLAEQRAKFLREAAADIIRQQRAESEREARGLDLHDWERKYPALAHTAIWLPREQLGMVLALAMLAFDAKRELATPERKKATTDIITALRDGTLDANDTDDVAVNAIILARLHDCALEAYSSGVLVQSSGRKELLSTIGARLARSAEKHAQG